MLTADNEICNLVGFSFVPYFNLPRRFYDLIYNPGQKNMYNLGEKNLYFDLPNVVFTCHTTLEREKEENWKQILVCNSIETNVKRETVLKTQGGKGQKRERQ